ncbi:MAG: hypothetical protein JWR58_21 [Pseudonocardia sp.]|nr:hypothetical protein [Pseudonocardia sp.]
MVAEVRILCDRHNGHADLRWERIEGVAGG